MEEYSFLPVLSQGIEETLRRFLADCMRKGIVDAVLVQVELPGKRNVVSAIVSSIDELDKASPLTPVLAANTARLVSKITRLSSSPNRLGVIMRSCELRALIELVKLKQASLENLLLIGIDCPGTYSLKNYQRLVNDGKRPTEEALEHFLQGMKDPLLRTACQMCEYPAPLGADVTIGLLGTDSSQDILLVAGTAKGSESIATLSLEVKHAERQSALAALVAERTKVRDALFVMTGKDTHGLQKLESTFSVCVGCHNCRVACPLCYCRECVFDSDVFDFGASKYLSWAKRKGALRLPTDTLLYHLTRLNHMAISCVGCGLCSEACPNDIPVANIFRLVGHQLQKKFDYVPGRSLDEELPLTTFREQELTDVGT